MRKNAQFKISQRKPLIGFIVPLGVIGIGLALPGNCIAGINETTLGFVATVIGVVVALWLARTPGSVVVGAHHD